MRAAWPGRFGNCGLVRERERDEPSLTLAWLSRFDRGLPASEARSGWLLKTAGGWTSPVPKMGPAGPLEPGSEEADALPHYLARRPRARHESPTAEGHQPLQGLEGKKENI